MTRNESRHCAAGDDQSYSHSPRLRLYTLLDTLVAVRMDLTRALDVADESRSSDPKLGDVRAQLDTAIASTRDIIAIVDESAKPR